MPKLIKNRSSEALTKEAVETYKANLKANRATLPQVQTVPDDILDKWEKMGPVRRTDYGPVLDVFVDNNDHLKPPHHDVKEAQTNMEIFDGSDDLIAAHETEIAFLKRRKTIAGALAYNMLKGCEAETDYLADKDNEAALITQIELNKLPKNNKPAPNKKTEDTKAADTKAADTKAANKAK